MANPAPQEIGLPGQAIGGMLIFRVIGNAADLFGQFRCDFLVSVEGQNPLPGRMR